MIAENGRSMQERNGQLHDIAMASTIDVIVPVDNCI